VWFHSLGIRAIRPQLGLAIPRIGHPIGGPSGGWHRELYCGTDLAVRDLPFTNVDGCEPGAAAHSQGLGSLWATIPKSMWLARELRA